MDSAVSDSSEHSAAKPTADQSASGIRPSNASASPMSTLGVQKPRYALLDTVRGAAVVAMVLFHLVYDLVFIYGVDMAWFRGTVGEAWEVAVGWTFVCVAGCSASLSHNNGKRACKLGLVALAITAVTGVARIDTPIYFGVIHCLAACTAVVCLAKPALDRLPRIPAALACLVLAVATSSVRDGFVQLVPGVSLFDIPDVFYRWNELSFLGFPGPTFSSGDYFPLFPYLFVYLCGYFAFAELAARQACRRVLCMDPVAPLALLGRHSLGIYLVHQVVIIAVLALVFGHL